MPVTNEERERERETDRVEYRKAILILSRFIDQQVNKKFYILLIVFNILQIGETKAINKHF